MTDMAPGQQPSPASANGVSRIGLWASIATSAAILIGVVGSTFFVAFSTRENSEAIIAQARINQAVDAEVRSLRERLTAQELALNEIETQFCAEDVVRNLMHANDMRTASMLWQKVFGDRMPTDNAYYPTICNRRVKQ